MGALENHVNTTFVTAAPTPWTRPPGTARPRCVNVFRLREAKRIACPSRWTTKLTSRTIAEDGFRGKIDGSRRDGSESS